MKIYITGVPGTGKSTLARELEKKGFYTIDMDAVKGLCDWVNLETNEKVRWYPGSSEQFFKENKFNCNKQELIELMKNNNDVIVAGVPGNRIELLDLFDKIILLECDEDVFIQRINKRQDNDFGKDPAEQKMLLNWQKEFINEMNEYEVITVNTNKPLSEVVDEIIGIINK